jgi:ATP-dependent helicase/nuclease subunit B
MGEQPLLPFDEPGPRVAEPPAASARIVAELARACDEEPLEEKVFLAPSLLVGHALVERLAREGHAWLNLRVETLRTLALGLIGPELAREGRRLLSRAQALALVEQACAEAIGPDSYFGALRERPGLHHALQRTLEELRAAGIEASAIPASAFADPRKAREIRAILERYAAALEKGKYVDSLEVLRRAAASELPAGPTPVRYLLPEDTDLSELERRLLERLAGDRLRMLPVDAPSSWTAQAAGARLLRAIGEENEIREAFRRILAEGIPFDDAEILHTDDAVYPALVWELAREHDIPCTFGGGTAVTYSRPGQAAIAFLDWIAEGFAAERLREALASGSLTLRHLGTGVAESSPRAAARALRQARVGWGRRRHVTAIDRLIRDLEAPERPSPRDEELREGSTGTQRSEARRQRLAAARLAKRFALRALELAPAEGPEDALRRLARGAGTFVSEFGRVTDDLDAAAKTALETLFREIADLPSAPVRPDDALDRLRDAVLDLSVLADRPRPGRVHVASYRTAGYSGRRHSFLMGLDDARHPGRDLEDPVLLDEERRGINAALPRPLLAMERERPREMARALQACVARLRGTLTASYSKFDLRNLSQAGEPAPSPFFLDLYRAQSGRPDADYRELLAVLEHARGFIPPPSRALDDTEWWLAEIREAGRTSAPGAAAPLVRSAYPWLEDGRSAVSAREGDDFTPWDGRLREPAPELDPRQTARPISASRIQALAQCPFSYFLRTALHVEPPDDLERDPTRWLEPKDEGTLLHETFRAFMEKITAEGERPETGRHLDLLLSIAEERITAWRERVPPSSEVAFEAQREGILHACRIFLRSETEHCRNVAPRWFEVPFGMPRAESTAAVASPDPVEIRLPGGARILLRGSIDRVDEAADGSFHVWDYKTGSAAGIQEGRGLRGGRQAQPALYAMAFEGLLSRSGRDARVSQSGYFFPGRKGEGQRMTVPVDARETGEALSRLFDLAASGMFPHAVSPEDCRFCEFQEVCGGAAEASAVAGRKLAASTDPVLRAFRQLHAEDED